MKRDMAAIAHDALRSVVLLNVTPQTAGAAAATLEALGANALACAAIVVAGDDAGLRADACAAAAGAIPLSVVSEAQRLAAVRKAVADTGAAGVLILSAGIHVPRGFDVRLARIAAQDSAVASVSPLCDLSAAHRLRDVPPVGASTPEETARLDRLAFLVGRRTYFEVPEALLECCFVPAAAMNRVAAEGGAPRAWMARLSAAGLLHVLTDSVYAAPLPGVALSPRTSKPKVESAPLAHSRQAILEADGAGLDFNAVPGLDARPVQLHVVHDLGGGTSKWLRDFGRADSSRTNMVLKALTHGQAMGTGLALYTDVMDAAPLRVWKLATDIEATVASHLEYRRILDEIVRDYCVDALFVSSLIGHSLDVLATGLPTVVVTHDYFPYCPAINIYFGGVCRDCDAKRIDECFRENTHFNPYVTFMPRERVQVRSRYLELVHRPNVVMATPSQSVADNLTRLNAVFGEVAFEVIPHGYGEPLEKIAAAAPAAGERLRVLVLGQLSRLKGVELLREALSALNKFADVWLLGAREVGEEFKFHPGVHVISEYEVRNLPIHVADINPHVALLTSIAPETFNYALTELLMLGVPVAATRVGSFPERIKHRENGYLYEPDVPSLVRMLGEINSDRETLARVRAGLADWAPRSSAEMVAAYHRIAPLEPRALARYPLGTPASVDGDDASSAPPGQALIAQATLLSSMWKDVKGLHTQLTIVNKARAHEQKTLEKRLAAITGLEARIGRQEALLAEREVHIQALNSHLEMKNAQVLEFLSSTSWKVSAPVRLVGRAARALKPLASHLKSLLGDPASLPQNLVKVAKAWRTGGVPEARRALHELQSKEARERAWRYYLEDFKAKVHPRIVSRIPEMSERPLISIIVPVFNPRSRTTDASSCTSGARTRVCRTRSTRRSPWRAAISWCSSTTTTSSRRTRSSASPSRSWKTIPTSCTATRRWWKRAGT